MNINDPFGRMQVRRRKDYESLRESLKKAGVTRRKDAEQLLANVAKRCRFSLAIAIPLTLLLVLMYPQGRILFIALGALVVLWVVNATRNGREYLKRYIDEELDED